MNYPCMKKSVVLLVFLLIFSFYSYDANSLDCGECVCGNIEPADPDVQGDLGAWELERNNCPEDRPVAQCGYQNYAPDCGTRCVCVGQDRNEEEPYCGDGYIYIDREECDVRENYYFNLGGKTCTNIGRGFNQGVLSCYFSGDPHECQFDVSGCSYISPEIDLRITVQPEIRQIRGDNQDPLICPRQSFNTRVMLTNIDDERRASPENLIIYDSIFYDEDCDGIGIFRSGRIFRDCNQLDYGESCIRTYSYLYTDSGCYYHNVRVDGDAQ